MSPDPLRGFILRALLWLPLCFAAWYGLAAIHAGVIGSLSRGAIDLFRPGLVTGLEQAGRELVFVTRILVHPAPGQSALVLPEVNPLLYTYGLAFFAALMLAARAKLWQLAVGVLLLLPFQVWGVVFDFLLQVGIRPGPEITNQAGLSAWQREAVALGYQLGNLVFPTVVPILLWGGFNRDFIAGLRRRM